MTAALRLPDGFRSGRRGAAILAARDERYQSLVEAELDRVEGWARRLGASVDAPGRGSTAVFSLGGSPVRLKQLRRGGVAGPLWRDRFPGTRRLIRNLLHPAEARRRGVRTPEVWGLLLVEGPTAFYRGWLAVAELEGARDLLTLVRSGALPTPPEWEAALSVVREMHDAGVDHRDLNLGNLLVRPSPGPVPPAYVIDLDGARVLDRPVPFRLRQRALRRLERSIAKSLPAEEATDESRNRIYRLYAGGDAELGRRLAAGRRGGRARVLLHRPGWKR